MEKELENNIENNMLSSTFTLARKLEFSVCVHRLIHIHPPSSIYTHIYTPHTPDSYVTASSIDTSQRSVASGAEETMLVPIAVIFHGHTCTLCLHAQSSPNLMLVSGTLSFHGR